MNKYNLNDVVWFVDTATYLGDPGKEMTVNSAIITFMKANKDFSKIQYGTKRNSTEEEKKELEEKAKTEPKTEVDTIRDIKGESNLYDTETEALAHIEEAKLLVDSLIETKEKIQELSIKELEMTRKILS